MENDWVGVTAGAGQVIAQEWMIDNLPWLHAALIPIADRYGCGVDWVACRSAFENYKPDPRTLTAPIAVHEWVRDGLVWPQ